MEQQRAPPEFTTQADPLEVTAVRLTKWHKRKARHLGNGNQGDGICYAIEQMVMNNMPPRIKEPRK